MILISRYKGAKIGARQSKNRRRRAITKLRRLGKVLRRFFTMEWRSSKVTPKTTTSDPPTFVYVDTDMAADLAAAFLEENEREQPHANTRRTGAAGRASSKIDTLDRVEPMETEVSPIGTPERE